MVTTLKNTLALGRWVALGCVVLAAGAAFAAAPAPAPKPGEKQYVSYRITRFDRLSVSVFDEPGLTVGQKKVDATGTIALTLIGEVRVVGLTILEAQGAIENAYREGRYLRNPQVTITIDEYAPRTVSISGKINAPGRYELPPDSVWTLKDLIIKASGFQETARGTKVRITRTMPDGSLKIFEKDVESLLRARSSANVTDAAFPLEPDDIVYVPEKII
jgi:polysaccharide export outer membrane protein